MNGDDINKLIVKDLGIDTYKENIIYLRADSHICKSEGYSALTRLEIKANGKSIIATLNVIKSSLLRHNEAGLSLESIYRLGVKTGDTIVVHHLHPVESIALVRGKIYGKAFKKDELDLIMKDIAAGRYSNVELAAFITACSGDNLSLEEIIFLTQAMIVCGNKLKWENSIVLDKHCVGGLPGNRTTPIVVSIIAAAGYYIPKTSSRAITSPAGTADTMEVLTNVELTEEQIHKVVSEEGGCLAWGGGVRLSPADNVLIPVEKALDIDSEGQMIASVLSKKVAAGSTHVVLDIPVGGTAKVRTKEDASRLELYFKSVGDAVGLHVKTVVTDGSQPVGVGIGPALEAMDVLKVLQNDADAPRDLKIRALTIAGSLFDLVAPECEVIGYKRASKILESGLALQKFNAIRKAQGAIKQPQFARYFYDIKSDKDGIVTSINNRMLAKVAKLAGSPKSLSAGIQFFSPLNKHIMKGDILFRLWAETNGELEYAKEYLKSNPDIVIIS